MFRRAITIQPYYPELRLLLIDSLKRLGPSHAEDCLREIMRAEADYDSFAGDSSSPNGRATAYFRLYQALPRQVQLQFSSEVILIDSSLQYREDAIRLLQKSIRLDGSNPVALVQRVMFYAEQEQYSLALESLNDMEKLTPGSAHIEALREQLQKRSAYGDRRARKGFEEL